jgi:hypothetical protein
LMDRLDLTLGIQLAGKIGWVFFRIKMTRLTTQDL